MAALRMKWSEKPSTVGIQVRAFLRSGLQCPWGEGDRDPQIPRTVNESLHERREAQGIPVYMHIPVLRSNLLFSK